MVLMLRTSNTPNNAINSDVQKRRFALLSHAGYGERWASIYGLG